MMFEAESLTVAGLVVLLEGDSDDGPFSLVGDTFLHDERLKTNGGRWDRVKQRWTFEDRDKLEVFIESLPYSRDSKRCSLHEARAAPFNSIVELTPLEKLLEHGPNVVNNGELLTLLLSFDRFLGDPAALSEALFQEFGGLGAILGSEPTRLRSIEHVAPRTIGLIKAVQLALERVLHEKVGDKTIIGSWNALTEYLGVRLKHRQTEEAIVLYLDRKNQLIKEQRIVGSIDHTPLYPDEIARRALELYAKSVILVHNHPTGHAEPSTADIRITKQIAIALDALNISLHDHLIVGAGEPLSFRAEGLI